jgi:hypothetical protein
MALNMDLIKKREQEIATQNARRGAGADKIYVEDGIKKYVMKDINNLRLVPLRNSDDFLISFYTHYNVGPEGAMLHCPQGVNQPCPVCKYIFDELYPAKTAEASALAAKIKGKQRFRSLVIDLDNPTEGVQFIEYGVRLLEQFNTTIGEWGDITDLATGRGLKVVRTISGVGDDQQTSYSVSAKKEAYPIDPFIMNQIPDLGMMIVNRIRSYEQIVGIMDGSVSIRGKGVSNRATLLSHVPKETADTPQEYFPIDFASKCQHSVPVNEISATTLLNTSPSLDEALAANSSVPVDIPPVKEAPKAKTKEEILALLKKNKGQA